MSDYYSHRDQARPGHRSGYPDYAETGTGGTWLWVAIVLVALVALIGAGLAGGGGENTTQDGAVAIEAAPAVPDATATPAAPAD
ncbi:MAG: hypothetical protein KJO42_02455 [Silicimonas sp.]|nr:hypothetical protein [Silicimonas sp.]NND22756.1 hypothetical protein [Silicimonas sp.]RZW06939.1 MAG: hypothetical protein EX266_06945 [Paracoccaceae bacterium]